MRGLLSQFVIILALVKCLRTVPFAVELDEEDKYDPYFYITKVCNQQNKREIVIFTAFSLRSRNQLISTRFEQLRTIIIMNSIVQRIALTILIGTACQIFIYPPLQTGSSQAILNNKLPNKMINCQNTIIIPTVNYMMSNSTCYLTFHPVKWTGYT